MDGRAIQGCFTKAIYRNSTLSFFNTSAAAQTDPEHKYYRVRIPSTPLVLQLDVEEGGFINRYTLRDLIHDLNEYIDEQITRRSDPPVPIAMRTIKKLNTRLAFSRDSDCDAYLFPFSRLKVVVRALSVAAQRHALWDPMYVLIEDDDEDRILGEIQIFKVETELCKVARCLNTTLPAMS